MRKLFYCIVLFVINFYISDAIAQKSSSVIRGKVTDENGDALPGAVVAIHGTSDFTTTGKEGTYILAELKDGVYMLEFSFVGYNVQKHKVTLKGEAVLNVSMDVRHFMTDEVLVSATRAGENTPSTYTIIDKAEISDQNFGQDLPIMLNWMPSLVTTSDAGGGVGYTGVRIRGSDATRINVTINGIPYNDAESLGTFWVDIPDIASSTESIQVQRGVGTSTNGAGSFGGTINLQTNTVNADPYGEVINSYGSFNTWRHSAGFGTGLLNDKWTIDSRVSKVMSDGYIDRASSDLSSYYFSGGYYDGNTIIKAIVFGGHERTYQSWYGVPESRLNNDSAGMVVTAMNEGWNEEQTNNLLNSDSRTFNPYMYKNQVDDYKQDHYQLHFSEKLSSELSFNLALHYTFGRGYYEEYKYDDSFENYGLSPVTIGDSVISSSDIIRRRWLNNDFYGLTYSLNYNTNSFEGIIGGGWNRYNGDHFGEIIWAEVSQVPIEYRYYFNNGDKRDFNTFVKGTYHLNDKITGFADLQYRRISYTVSGIENKQNSIDVDEVYNFFNPKFGITYSLNKANKLYASYSVANREPVRDDFVDNPGNVPKHETLHNLETGIKHLSEKLTLDVNYYFMDYKNQLVLTGGINDVGASVRTNVKDSYRMGVEIAGKLKILPVLDWNANITFSSNKIKSFTEVLYDYGAAFNEFNIVSRDFKDTDISFSPRVIAGSGLTYMPVKGAEITLLSKYVGKQYLDNTSNDQRKIDGYFLNDVRISYMWNTTLLREIDFSILVNNIFNTEYESNGYTWGYLGGGAEYRENYYYPQAGTNFMFKIGVKF